MADTSTLAPKDFTLSYSDDATAWTTIITTTGETGWATDETRLFQAPLTPVVNQLNQLWHLLVSAADELIQPYGELLTAGQLNQPYSINVAAQLSQPYGHAVAAEFKTPYAVRAATDLNQPYGHGVTAQLSAPYALRIAPELNQSYALRIAATLKTPYTAPLVATLTTPFGYSITAELSQSWTWHTPVAGQIGQPFSDSIPVAAELASPYALLALNPIAIQLNQPWSMADPATILLSTPATLTHNGIYIKMARYQVSMAEGGWNWTARIDLADPADYATLAKDNLLTLAIGGDTWQLVINGKSLVRAQTQARPIRQIVIECLGSAARYEAPRATRITQQWDQAIDAQTAVETIIGASIDWQITSWTIPAGRLAATDADPITLVRSIINAVGGTLQANPDGTLLARPLFPVTVPDWASADPDQLYTDLGDILEVRETGGTTELIDSVVVADQPAALALLSLEIDSREAGLNAGRFEFGPGESVGVLGFHPRSVTIGDVTASTGSISSAAEQLVELDEDLLFAANNSAELLRPAEAIISAVWLGTDLGSVLLEADQKTITATTPGVSMLRVKYQALAQAWQVNTPLSAGGDTEFPIALVAEFES